MINLSGVENQEDLLSRVMTTVHGPLLSGDDLVEALGYDSLSALRQAKLRNMLPVTLFSISARRKNFALCVEVADWLIQQRKAKSEHKIEIDLGVIESKFSLLKLFILDYGYLLSESDLIKLLNLDSENAPVQTYYLNKQPFALFRIDHRHTKRFALTIEAFQYLCVPD